jgi:hypothetical protein
MTQVKQTTTNVKEVVASIPLPSADLIIYRFDQIDAQLQATNTKLDRMTTSFVTKEEVANLKAERLAQIKVLENKIATLDTTVTFLSKTNDRQQGSIDVTRRITTVVLAVVAIIVSAAAVYLGVHK